MTYFCSKCVLEVNIEGLVQDEIATGILFSCPVCGGPVLHMNHEEYEAEEATALYLDEEQELYLSHILDKQLDKLEHATDLVTSIREQLSA